MSKRYLLKHQKSWELQTKHLGLDMKFGHNLCILMWNRICDIPIYSTAHNLLKCTSLYVMSFIFGLDDSNLQIMIRWIAPINTVNKPSCYRGTHCITFAFCIIYSEKRNYSKRIAWPDKDTRNEVILLESFFYKMTVFRSLLFSMHKLINGFDWQCCWLN